MQTITLPPRPGPEHDCGADRARGRDRRDLGLPQDERRAETLYDRAGGENVEHWNLPDATHTAGIRQEAAPYEARVTAFFDRELR